jgi:hypothetical protein
MQDAIIYPVCDIAVLYRTKGERQYNMYKYTAKSVTCFIIFPKVLFNFTSSSRKSKDFYYINRISFEQRVGNTDFCSLEIYL